VKLLDFAHCNDDTVKVAAIRIDELPTEKMPVIQPVEQRYAHLYLDLREVGVSEELAQCILKLVRFEVEP
jgi:hypothetical protein